MQVESFNQTVCRKTRNARIDADSTDRKKFRR